MSVVPERFDQILQEKLDELDAAAEQETLLACDEIEQLRLRAAALITRGAHRPWAAGTNTTYQHDGVAPEAPPPILDIRFPTRRADTPQAGSGGGASSKRQGRRVP